MEPDIMGLRKDTVVCSECGRRRTVTNLGDVEDTGAYICILCSNREEVSGRGFVISGIGELEIRS